jgi:hypothetical protein
MAMAIGTCPQCASALRESEARLVCDACDGMLIRDDDYAASLRALDGSSEKLEVGDRERLDIPCPRCANPMESCQLSYGGLALGAHKRCDTDGVWVANEGMIGAFAVVGHRVRRRRGGGVLDPAAGASRVMATTLGGIGGASKGGGAIAIRAVANAFANRPQFVSLGSVLPRTRTAFASAFAGQELTCPVCSKPLGFEADRWACSSCTGSFVEDAALVAMVQDITRAYWEMPAPTQVVGARNCPACAKAMTVEHFQSAEIDRCTGHGVWFDTEELERTLIESTSPKETGGWLKRLFG